jgi:hypothetical protein
MMATNAQWAFYTRSDRRYVMPRTEELYVELDDPEYAGARRRFALSNLSNGGLAFDLLGDLPNMERNASMPIVICLGGCVLLGDFVISHVTTESEFRTSCGGKFYPKTQADRRRLGKFLGGFELSN